MGPMLPTTAGLDDERAERTVPPRPVEEVDEAPLPRLDGPTLPRRLASEPPGWVREVDVVVVGSGVAGLTAALECRERMGPGSRVMVVTKDVVAAGSTRWAQGGIASVQAEGDTVAEHVTDTLVAGAGLCEPAAVDVLVREGPAEVATLVERGTQFDLDAAGQLALTREGGHHRNRIAHAGGDATGAEIERALVASVKADPGIEIVEQALVLDLLPAVTEDGAPAVAGVTLHVLGEGTRQGVGAVRARAVVLATGGIGQIYAVTTNPPVSTGDGVAAALRAGARLRDVEFIQFHPTVLFLGTGARGQLPLVSEAVRGEGGLLVNSAGERFMVGQHELAELAPARRRRQGDHEGDGPRGHRPRLRRRPDARRGDLAGPVPDDPAQLPGGRHRPGHRPDPGRARPRTTSAAAWRPTSRAPRTSPASTPAARSPPPGCTAPTGSRPTRCSRAWSSRRGSPGRWPATCRRCASR